MLNKAPQKPLHPSRASVGKARPAKSSGNQSNKAGPTDGGAQDHVDAREQHDEATKRRQEQDLMAKQAMAEQTKRMAGFMFWQTLFQIVVGVALLIGLGATLYYVRQIARRNKFSEQADPRSLTLGANPISRASPPQALTSINKAASNFDWKMAVGGRLVPLTRCLLSSWSAWEESLQTDVQTNHAARHGIGRYKLESSLQSRRLATSRYW